MSTTTTGGQRTWWRTMIAHRPVDGRCPRCGVARCWRRAEARAALIVAGLWHLGPPADL
ncbi:hypothetical protein OOK41_31505 [Micromonospora sp. NBC_01655]|uniref:hypothetical protein n=1 Tax=Micromonospora sp. NBC_01655 TaxID=2975983 RepID=UPI00224E002E|nr:hypothetical protein [Micromonospora sp. NBC_01655]MCX4474788.1 hypothetical protein [Micromonospora sp. NBC_01655]